MKSATAKETNMTAAQRTELRESLMDSNAAIATSFGVEQTYQITTECDSRTKSRRYHTTTITAATEDDACFEGRGLGRSSRGGACGSCGLGEDNQGDRMTPIEQKALRLLTEGRVREHVLSVTVLRVEGDHGTYEVVIGPGIAMCSCDAPGRCSHIEAAVVRARATDEQREILDELVERRATTRRAEGERVLASL